MSLFEEVKADVVADQGRGRVLTVRSLASPGLLPSSFPLSVDLFSPPPPPLPLRLCADVVVGVIAGMRHADAHLAGWLMAELDPAKL